MELESAAPLSGSQCKRRVEVAAIRFSPRSSANAWRFPVAAWSATVATAPAWAWARSADLAARWPRCGKARVGTMAKRRVLRSIRAGWRDGRCLPGQCQADEALAAAVAAAGQQRRVNACRGGPGCQFGAGERGAQVHHEQ